MLSTAPERRTTEAFDSLDYGLAGALRSQPPPAVTRARLGSIMIVQVRDTASRVTSSERTIMRSAFLQVTSGAACGVACGNRTHDLRITRVTRPADSPCCLRLCCNFIV
jgi:hypothetical protein